MEEQKGINIKILGKEFKVSCPDGKEQKLFEAADLLNQQMTNISSKNNVVGLDKIAIMAALNVTSELLQLKDEKQQASQYNLEIERKLENLQLKLCNAIVANDDNSLVD